MKISQIARIEREDANWIASVLKQYRDNGWRLREYGHHGNRNAKKILSDEEEEWVGSDHMLFQLAPYSMVDRTRRIKEILCLPSLDVGVISRIYKERGISMQVVKNYRRVDWHPVELHELRQKFALAVGKIERSGLEAWYYDQTR